MANNIFQEQIVADKPNILNEQRVSVYIPKAGYNNAGIASYNEDQFRMYKGKVNIRETDPTERPSMIMIKDKVEGLERYTENGHHYIRTYLKSINGESIVGNTNLKLVTLDSVQTLDAQSLGSGVAMKKVLLNNSSNEAYGLQVAKYGSTENVSIGSNRVEIYNSSLQSTTFSYRTITTNDGSNEYTLLAPLKSGTIALQSDIGGINEVLDTKVDKVVTNGGNKTTITNSGNQIIIQSEVTGTNEFTKIAALPNTVGITCQDSNNIHRSGITLIDNSISMYNQDNDYNTTLTIESNAVKINDVVIPKVVAGDSTSAVYAYNTVYINSMKSDINNSINAITVKIPEQASADNQLADKNFVNSSINNSAAYYITYNAQGEAFPTRSALINATTFYSGGEVRTPTRNDYCIVRDDETQDNATTRYSYQNNQWEFQYVVNETPMTAAQVAAINSGITNALVAQITTNQNDITALQSGKQDTLTAGTGITIDSNNVISSSVDTSNLITLDTTTQTFDGSKNFDVPIYNTLTFRANDNGAIKGTIELSLYTKPTLMLKENDFNSVEIRQDKLNGSYIRNIVDNYGYDIKFPKKSGTFALTSDIGTAKAVQDTTDNSVKTGTQIRKAITIRKWH